MKIFVEDFTTSCRLRPNRWPASIETEFATEYRGVT
jgi:hypothetical protein